MADIYFLIECKSTKKPWIIFTAEYTREALNPLSTLAITSERADEFITDNAKNLYDSLKWIVKKGRIGFSMTQAFTEGQDVTYEAIHSAIKASLALYNDNENQKKWKIPFLFAFPVIITASPLFECYLDNDGDIKLQEISEGSVYFDGKIENFSGVCIRVVSENALMTFQNDIDRLSDFLLELLKNDIEKEWIAWQERVNNDSHP